MSLGEMIGSEYFNLLFPDEERPDVQKGEEIALNMQDESGDIHSITAKVQAREDFPGSYCLSCCVELPEGEYNLEMYISHRGQNAASDWARIWRRNVVEIGKSSSAF